LEQVGHVGLERARFAGGFHLHSIPTIDETICNNWMLRRQCGFLRSENDVLPEFWMDLIFR
jgi:hypothetical protein